MTDYNSLKVPELKKLLSDRSLQISGNKADLIARLQEADKKPASGTAEDEIDWDEDDSKPTITPAATAVTTGSQGVASTSVAAPTQKKDEASAKSNDAKAEGVKDAPKTADPEGTSSGVTATEPASVTTEVTPKVDFSMGIQQTDVEKEAERRAARAKRFGLTEDDETKKLAERAKKFGTDTQNVVKGLDDALPERRKRGREDKDKQGGRGAKRQTPDRRTEAAPAKVAGATTKKPVGRILDDPVEKAKAEARAKRFQT